MIFLYAFLVGGGLCALAQFLMDRFKLVPLQVICIFIATGAALDTLSLYDKIVKFAGAGAQLPIMSFGHSVVHGAMAGAAEKGIMGIAAGIFNLTATGITTGILFAVLAAVIFRPKS